MKATHAITRGISASFADAITQRPHETIDVALARRQHAAYVAALRDLGIEVVELPPIDESPDACFVEDCVIHDGGLALITRPGAPSRLREVTTVAATLARWLPTVRTDAPATLDGGDCLRAGRMLFVGRSRRTNAAGAARVEEVFAPRGSRVTEVAVTSELHLKCTAGVLDDRRVLVAAGAFAPDAFRGLQRTEVPAAEAYAANVVSVNGTVLVAAGFPETARIVASLGLRVLPLEMSEIAKADGSLTCLSILF